MSFWTTQWLPFIFDSYKLMPHHDEIGILDPYREPEVQKLCEKFYSKYYNDDNVRRVIFGINPGRLGAGMTGISFTDPEKLENNCSIPNNLEKKEELSSRFIYQWIESAMMPDEFYRQFIIVSVCPLGFIKGGKNVNYYDDKDLQKSSQRQINEHQKLLQNGPIDRTRAFILGKGKNYAYFQKANKKNKWFDRVIPLPHPRWVMQYRYKRRYEFMDEMMTTLFETN